MALLIRASWVPKLAEIYKVDIRDMIYVGDDIFDYDIMRMIMNHGGRAYCPSDACLKLRMLCGDFNTLSSPGGSRVVMELYEKLGDTVR